MNKKIEDLILNCSKHLNYQRQNAKRATFVKRFTKQIMGIIGNRFVPLEWAVLFDYY